MELFNKVTAGRLALPEKVRVNLLALGDVGSTLLLGLRLMGADVLDSIGICDVNEKAAARWEFEINQIAFPWNYDALPPVDVVPMDKLMDCDVFVFVASKGIPPVGSGVKDVRMAQYENNKAIVSQYAKQAREAGFKGLFCVVSDPVDALARAAWQASNTDENGNFDGKGLRPEQVQGYGLGVMNARAAYYAKRQPELFGDFLTEGRAFGPHGQDLVIANSIANYDDERSRALTKLAVTANMEMRALGYKPYYLYRQKYMSGSFENVGWSRDNLDCLYNIYMMEEVHTILSLGGGGMNKVNLPDGTLRRFHNPKFPEQYIEMLPGVLEQKQELFRLMADGAK